MKNRRCLMIGPALALAGVLLLAGVALAQNQGGGRGDARRVRATSCVPAARAGPARLPRPQTPATRIVPATAPANPRNARG